MEPVTNKETPLLTNTQSTPSAYQACKRGNWHLVKKVPANVLERLIREGDEKAVGEIFQRELVADGWEKSLHLAAKHGWPKIVVALLPHITINSIHNGQTPLHVAIGAGQHQAVTTFVANKARLNFPVLIQGLKLTPAEYAVVLGDVPCLKELRKGGVNLKKITSIGSLLHIAITFGQQQMLKYLLNQKVIDIEVVNQTQQTPLILAAALGNSEAVYLLYKGFQANLNADDETGKTALHWACLNRHRHTVQTLHFLGADLQAIDHKHRIPMKLLDGAKDFTGKSLHAFLGNLSTQTSSKPDFGFRPPRHLAFANGQQAATFAALAELKRKGKLSDVMRISASGTGVYPAILYAVGYDPSNMTSLWKQNLESLIHKATKIAHCTLGELKGPHLYLFAMQKGTLRRFSTEKDHDLVISFLAKTCLTSGILTAKRNDGTLVKQTEMGTFTKTNHFPIDAFDQRRYLFYNSTSGVPAYNKQTLGFCPQTKKLSTHNQERTLQLTTPQAAARIVNTLFPSSSLNPFTLGELVPSEGQILVLDAPHPDFVGRETKIQQLKTALIDDWKPKEPVRLRVLCGIGGVGKSEIARKFANNHSSHFSLIYWIPGRSQEERENALRELAPKIQCRLDPKDTYAIIQKKVYETLERTNYQKPYLLIFDHLDHPEKLPQRNGSVLITSQTQKPWLSTQVLFVPTLTDAEATSLVKKLTKENNSATIKRLFKAIGTLPLALDQACALIFSSHITVDKYLKQGNFAELLTSPHERYKQSLETTWKLALSRLSQPAQDWLSVCAYLSPDAIPREWIKIWAEDDRLAEQIFRNLANYHLIRPHGTKPFAINPLLQQVLKTPKGYVQALQLVATQTRLHYFQPITDTATIPNLLNHIQALLKVNSNHPVRSELKWLALPPLNYLARRRTDSTLNVRFDSLVHAIIWHAPQPKSLTPMMQHVANLSLSDQVHLKIFKGLSLTPLRYAYYQTLEKRGKKALCQQLVSIPTRDGSRLEPTLKERALIEQLKSLTTTTPSPYTMRIAGSDTTYYLNPKIISQILDKNGNIKRDYKNSMHAVSRLKTTACDLHFKQTPSHPMMEYAVHSLTSRMMGVATPASTLIRFSISKRGKTLMYPVLVTETIQGLNLKKMLQNDPNVLPDNKHLTWQALLGILIKPGDARASNYIIDRKNRIFSIDNDVAFVEPITKTGLFRKVNFASIIYCLWPQHLDVDVLAEFTTLSPELILEGWLDELIAREKTYCNLFTQQEIDHLYNTQDNFTPTLLLRGGTTTNLYLQFHLLQRYLQDHMTQQLTPVDLLTCVTTLKTKTLQESGVGRYLFKYYRSAMSRTSPLNRLKDATSRKQDQSMTTPEVLGATIGRTPTSAEIRNRQLFSLEKAKQELSAYSILRVGNVRFDQHQGKKRLSVNFALIHKDQTPDVERQEAILRGLHLLFEDKKKLPATIILRNCAALTQERLLLFLHQNLTYLDITGSRLSSIPEEIETECPNLEELYLSDSHNLQTFKNGGYFSSPFTLPKLKHLHVAHCPQLKEIRLRAPCLSMLKINNNPKLVSLDFENLSTLLLIKETPKLNISQWAQNLLKAKGLENIDVQSFPKNLIHLLQQERHHWKINSTQGRYSIMGNLIQPIKIEKGLPPPLQSLNLQFNKIGDAGAKIIVEALKSNTSLQSLDLLGNKISDAGVKVLAKALKSNTSLQSLDLGRNKIGDAGVKVLAEALKSNTSLQSLDLWRNKISDAGAKMLAEALKSNTSLQSLHLRRNKIGDAGVKVLAKALKSNTSLQSLDLGDSKIGDAGAKVLAEALKSNTSLQSLGLWNDYIGPAGAKMLAEALKSNTSLQSLDLRSNKIGDAGVKVLAEALESNTSLQSLKLGGNSDSGIISSSSTQIKKLFKVVLFGR